MTYEYTLIIPEQEPAVTKSKLWGTGPAALGLADGPADDEYTCSIKALTFKTMVYRATFSRER